MKWFILLAVAAAATTAAADEGFSRGRRGAAALESRVPTVSTTAFRYQPVPQAYEDFPAAAYPAGYSSYRGLGYQGSCCEQQPVHAQKAWHGYCASQACGRPHPGLLQGLAACLSRLHCKRHEACGYQKGCNDCARCVAADPCQPAAPRHGLWGGWAHSKARVANDCCSPYGAKGKGSYGGTYFYGGSGGYDYQPTPASPEVPPSDLDAPLPPPPPPPAAEQSTEYNRPPRTFGLDRSARGPERSRSTFPQSNF